MIYVLSALAALVPFMLIVVIVGNLLPERYDGRMRALVDENGLPAWTEDMGPNQKSSRRNRIRSVDVTIPSRFPSLPTTGTA